MATPRSGRESSKETLEKGLTGIKGRFEVINGKLDNLSAVVIQMQRDLQILLRRSSQETGEVQPQGSLSSQGDSVMEAVKKIEESNVFGCARVSNEIEEDRLDNLYGLRQESSVEDFRRRFEFYSAHLLDIPDTVLKDIFWSGLKEEIKRNLIQSEISDLHGLIQVAKKIEECDNFGCATTGSIDVLGGNSSATVNKGGIWENLSRKAANPLSRGIVLVAKKMGCSSGSSPRNDQIRDIQIPNFSSQSSTPSLLIEQSPPPPTLKLAHALCSTNHQHRFFIKKPEWSSVHSSRVDPIREVTIELAVKEPSGSPTNSSGIDRIIGIPNPNLRTPSPAANSFASKSPRLLSGFGDVNKGRKQREIARKRKRKKKRFKQENKREEEDQRNCLIRLMREDEAAKTNCFLEASTDNKGISKKVLKNWVVNVFREQRAFTLSLSDTKTAVNKLHHLLNVLVVLNLKMQLLAVEVENDLVPALVVFYIQHVFVNQEFASTMQNKIDGE